MDIDAYLEGVLFELGDIFNEMSAKITPPVFTDIGGGIKAWRYHYLSESLVCFLKGVKMLSTLNASMVLLRAGYAQEIGALCRMIDDYCNEIFFLLEPQDGNTFSKEQIQFMTDFFQEEFDRPTDPLGSTQKRVNVPVRKIHATCGRMMKDELNPSDIQELLHTTHQALSGYIHGAYPHIMEMFRGSEPRLNGMLGTPRIDEWRRQLIIYIYRSLVVSVFISKKLGLNETEIKVRQLQEKFESNMEYESSKLPRDMIAEMKKKNKSAHLNASHSQ